MGSPEPQSRGHPHGSEGFLCHVIDSGFDLMGQLLGSAFNKSNSGEQEGQSSQSNVPPDIVSTPFMLKSPSLS